MASFSRIIFATMTLFLTIFLVGCGGASEGSNVASDNRMDNTDDLTSAVLESSGSFVDANGYEVSGNAQLFFNSVTDQYSLVLDNFSSDDGPSLFVYLSQGRFATNFLNLGDLTALNGTLRYDFSASDFDPSFNYALIWCDAFSVSFGEALLQP